MRVRTSAGIRPVEFFGNCHIPNTTDIELACVDPDAAVTLELRHDDKLQDNDLVFIQVRCFFLPSFVNIVGGWNSSFWVRACYGAVICRVAGTHRIHQTWGLDYGGACLCTQEGWSLWRPAFAIAKFFLRSVRFSWELACNLLKPRYNAVSTECYDFPRVGSGRKYKNKLMSVDCYPIQLSCTSLNYLV